MARHVAGEQDGWLPSQSVLQKCPPGRMSYKTVPQVCPTVFTTVSQMSSTSVLRECPTRMIHGCPTTLSYKSVFARVLYMSVPQVFLETITSI